MSRIGFDIYLKHDALHKEIIKIQDEVTLYEDPPRITSELLEKILPELKARFLALSTEGILYYFNLFSFIFIYFHLF